mmetsp:Transcript_32269/g.94369  ORF Transcript_32269/g.94369 Transcript_32269/m.94369 type:complete len:211 (-) Transcript_32269:118-750(-)
MFSTGRSPADGLEQMEPMLSLTFDFSLCAAKKTSPSDSASLASVALKAPTTDATSCPKQAAATNTATTITMTRQCRKAVAARLHSLGLQPGSSVPEPEGHWYSSIERLQSTNQSTPSAEAATPQAAIKAPSTSRPQTNHAKSRPFRRTMANAATRPRQGQSDGTMMRSNAATPARSGTTSPGAVNLSALAISSCKPKCSAQASSPAVKPK